MLLAAMGERYVTRHPFRDQSWFQNSSRAGLDQFKKAQAPIGDFDPQPPPPVSPAPSMPTAERGV
jgi:putative GTP pyrophosphokinase